MLKLAILLVLVLMCSGTPRRKKLHQRVIPVAEEGIYRLPNNVLPVHYSLSIQLEEDAFLTDSFSGVSTINIVTTESTNVVVFHAKNVTINSVELRSGDLLLNASWSEIDPDTETVRVETETELSPEELYTLSIGYSGSLAQKSLDGFYKSSYKYNNSAHYAAATQFEAISARKAFPCFDEPALKATFQLTLTFPQGYNALSNTPVVADLLKVPGTNLRRVTFGKTPKMSTYLLAFVVSEFDCTQGDSGYEIRTEVCSRQDTTNLRTAAVRAAPQILEVMKDYTKYDYASSGIGKLTQITLPDFGYSGMENWGLVTYGEYDLFLDEEEQTDIYSKQNVVIVIAHELAHQWFGDLVTLHWWSDVFLNEGLAGFFQYYAVDEIYPEWELPNRWAEIHMHPVMTEDISLSSLPLSNEPKSNQYVMYGFDAIAYDKGGSLIRMIRYFLGLENFKAGLADYIAENQFSTSTPTILWNSFEKYAQSLPEPQKPPVPMVELMANWTYQAGFPVLTVTKEGDDVRISQKRYLESGSSDTKWYVPVTYTLAEEASSDTTTRAWLTPGEDLVLEGVLANSTTIVVNNQQIGYYRVAYSDELLQKISQGFQVPSLSGIDAVTRAHIVDDLFSFAKTGLRNYSTVLDFVSYLQNEREYYPWRAALNGFSHILSRINDQDLYTSLKEYISNLIKPLYSSANEKPDNLIHTLKYELIADWTCFLNGEACATKSLADFKPRKSSSNRIYCNSLRHSENPASDLDFLWQKYLQTSVLAEQQLILESFGCTSNEEVLRLYLEETLMERTRVSLREIYAAWASALGGGPKRINTIFDFLTSNYQKLVSHFGSTDDLGSLIYDLTDRFTTQEQVNKLRSFIEEAGMEDFKGALENAEAKLGMAKVLEEELIGYLH